MRWSITVVGVFTLLLSGACSSSENSGNQGISGAVANETPCQKLCRRAGQVSAACAPADCESKCETTLPQCDAEYRSYVECLANAQMLGCDSSNNPTAGGDCAGQQQSFQSCLLGGTGGAGGMGGAGGTGGTGGGGATGPCDPLAASCVGCGTGDPCGAGESCCYEDPTPSCKPTGSCGGIQASCDGAEDCPGAECCVQFVTQMDGSAKSGGTQCSAAGSTTCCSPTPGVGGCAADQTVQQCVCAQDDYCCSTEWDAQCASEITKFGCGSCGAGCDKSAASVSSGSSIKSVSCRTSADCAGVKGSFSVPYSECCFTTNLAVGACVSQTYAGSITSAGGTCK